MDWINSRRRRLLLGCQSWSIIAIIRRLLQRRVLSNSDLMIPSPPSLRLTNGRNCCFIRHLLLLLYLNTVAVLSTHFLDFYSSNNGQSPPPPASGQTSKEPPTGRPTDTLRSDCLFCYNDYQKFNLSKVPSSHNVAQLMPFVGIWRSENKGKAFFPTIPNFAYGEQLEIGLSNTWQPNVAVTGAILEYRAISWGMNRTTDEQLHSEYGFIAVDENGKVALNTAMNNGFTSLEEGFVSHGGRKLRLVTTQIGRLSWGHDVPVKRMLREWTLLANDRRAMEARLSIETTSAKGLREHAIAIFEKIYPTNLWSQ